MKNLWMKLKGVYYTLMVFIRPGNLNALIKVGNLISETQAFALALDKIKEDPDAQALINERYSAGLPPMEELQNYAPNTLGRLFYEHIHQAGLDTFPTQDMSGYTETVYLRERRRELHDVLHVVLDYETSLPGEACLNTYLASGATMPVCLLIPIGVVVKTIFKQPTDLHQLMQRLADAWQKGQQTRSPFGIRWEDYLDRDISEAKAVLFNRELVAA